MSVAVRPLAFITLVLFSGLSVAQTTPRILITKPVDENQLTVLNGNTHPLARAEFDRGVAPADLPMSRMLLILKRSDEQETALRGLIDNQQDKASPNYHKWLTPEQFGKQFGPSDQDIAQVTSWLQSHGFQIAQVSKGRTVIEFSGTAAQVQEALHTSIHKYAVSGEEHWANASDPQIPAALTLVVGGVTSLSDFKPIANVAKGSSGRWDPNLERFVPDLTGTISGQEYLFLGPGDAATIYNTPNSLNIHLASGQSTYDGTGVTIGIAGTTLLYYSGDASYRSFFGLPENGATSVYDGSYSNFDNNADETEANLDTEIAGGVAPGAKVVYYAAGDTLFQSGLILAIYRAIDDNQVDILSVSYSACEAAMGAAGNLEILNAWEQAAAQGMTVTVSTDDSGSAGCDDPNTETAATQGLGVNGLASTPYNIAVGGTDFDVLKGSFATYVASTNGANYTSALNYIPENPWNDSTTTNRLLSGNTVGSTANIWAGGGGASSAGNGGLAGYPKPAWQRGYPASNNDAVRDLPDVSLMAGGGKYGALWGLCIDTDCSNQTTNLTIHGVGGTSASAPAFAGILALVSQKVGAGLRLGQANWVLYKLAQTAPSVFHQVTIGNNSVHCVAGSTDCGTNGFMAGYNSGAGYNLATGLGSVDATNLVNHWGDDSLVATTTTLTLDKTNFVHGTAVNVTAGVNPSSATGNVAIEDNYATQPQASTSTTPTLLGLKGGTASGTYALFPGGTYNVYARYGGDGSYSGSLSQPVQLTVRPEDSLLQLTVEAVNPSGQLVNAAGGTFPLGTLISMNARPIGTSQAGSASPTADATGTVYFRDPLSTNFPAPLDATGNAEINFASFSAGTHAISASYAGDLSYNPSTAGPTAFSVTKGPTTITVTADASSTIGSSVGVLAQIATTLPANSSYSGTGTVTFTDTTSNTVLGTGYVNTGCTGVSAVFCMQSFLQVNAIQLAAGPNSIVATYAGDSNFLASGPSAPVTVTCIAGCSNPSGQSLGLSFYQGTGGISSASGGTITTPVNVSASTGFTGAVNLTCSVAGKNAADRHVPTCSFSPAQVNVTGNQAGSTTMTIISPASSANVLAMSRAAFGFGGIAITGMLLMMLPRWRGRKLCSWWFGLAAVLAVGMTACGGGSGSSSGGTTGGSAGSSGPTPDVYTVTFRAADAATGTVTAQDYFNFTVN